MRAIKLATLFAGADEVSRDAYVIQGGVASLQTRWQRLTMTPALTGLAGDLLRAPVDHLQSRMLLQRDIHRVRQPASRCITANVCLLIGTLILTPPSFTIRKHIHRDGCPQPIQFHLRVLQFALIMIAVRLHVV